MTQNFLEINTSGDVLLINDSGDKLLILDDGGSSTSAYSNKLNLYINPKTHKIYLPSKKHNLFLNKKTHKVYV